MDLPKITLHNLLGEGGLEELFQNRLSEIIDNIRDINTDATKAREITIKIKVVPDKNRESVFTSAQVTTKLAGIQTEAKQNYITSNRNGELILGTMSPFTIPIPFEEEVK